LNEVELTNRLVRCYSGAVYDVLRELGRRECILPKSIRPVDDALTLAGPVWTCSGHLDESLNADETLLGWTGMLSKAPRGSVVVCQPNDSTISHMGELSAETLQARGVRGYIVDGGCRDVAFIRGIRFPVFCRYFTPSDVVGRWRIDSLGEPIEIGGVEIATGDFVIADVDGAVLIPRSVVEDVVARTEGIMNTESDLRAAIRSGMDPQEAYLKFRVF